MEIIDSNTPEYHIHTENSTVHWKYFNVKDKNVLDLGCGLWDVRDVNEMSPFYFYKQGAKTVIGIDTLDSDINFLNENNLDKDRITFIKDFISTDQQVKDLIKTHNINSIKSDIEKSETLFYNFTADDFKSIDTFALEYHGSDIKQGFLSRYKDWGFKLIAHGTLTMGEEEYGVLFFEK